VNDLSMAPLLARIKHGKDLASIKLLFLCGVRECPEILGVARPHFLQGQFHFYKPYFPDAQGVFRCTRRSARRLEAEREHNAVVRADAKRGGGEYEEMTMKSHDPRKIEGLQVPPVEAFPIVVRCARCGRESKIMEARERS
jgi:hypothetical protein